MCVRSKQRDESTEFGSLAHFYLQLLIGVLSHCTPKYMKNWAILFGAINATPPQKHNLLLFSGARAVVFCRPHPDQQQQQDALTEQ
jgi:hypothetical protein